ncbi:MAG: acyl-CoA thioesterase [Rhodospirillaceae bacterium]|jgi:acyl-CoA thioesterase YciA|uniref:acyl-CoA thioesterase n=1 Tax=unclassified Hwanghaeella TaxID=2605944 RepID=UPI000C642027|nr:acyl-CoA thioesterase [Rhodospirillales bacterium]MAX46999.1 acyl-CoA thioesterase [Rhodospirillaceae bacterium]|tara:strand:- start:91 stop:480 length:390 start_codon:yes stop_codon:yes gene_type:complete
MTTDSKATPRGELQIRTIAMPADTNPAGDIFGGWVLSQMDVAGGIAARDCAKGRVVTVAVDTMTFYLPVFVGDVVCCYTSILKKGRTSISVNIQTWALRSETMERVLVTEGTYTYVSIGSDRKPRPMSE